MNVNFDDAKFNMILCYLKQGNKAKARGLYEDLQKGGPEQSLGDRMLEVKNQIYS